MGIIIAKLQVCRRSKTARLTVLARVGNTGLGTTLSNTFAKMLYSKTQHCKTKSRQASGETVSARRVASNGTVTERDTPAMI